MHKIEKCPSYVENKCPGAKPHPYTLALYLPLLESALRNRMPMFVSILLRRAYDYGEQILISEGTLAAQTETTLDR